MNQYALLKREWLQQVVVARRQDKQRFEMIPAAAWTIDLDREVICDQCLDRSRRV